MSDRNKGNGETDDFVLETEESEDLEAAFQDALEAVERSGRADEDADAAERGASVEVERLREELQQSQDRLVRALADFDNYRKRTERERSEDQRYAGFGVLREIVGVVDNLERALEAGGSADDLKTGVRLIHKQMEELLKRHGVSRIPAVGEAFDPRVHEALSRREDPDVEVPTVSEELEAGYSMRDRLLRPARVIVAMPQEAPAGGGSEESPE